MRRSLALAPLLFACARPSPESQPPASAEAPTVAESQPASESSSELPPDIFDGDPMFPRLEEVARTHADEQIERLALWDIAFPDGPEEALELQGFAVAVPAQEPIWAMLEREYPFLFEEE